MHKTETKFKFIRDLFFGEIKFYQNEKNYGFVTESKTGKDYFFLRKDVALKDEEILSHLPVSFSLEDDYDPKTGAKVKRAILVREFKI